MEPPVYVLLPGGATVNVVGESHYQDAIEAVAGGKTEEPTDARKWAQLIREPDNDFDRSAVMVQIDGHKVGYLSRDEAPAYGPLLDRLRTHHNATAVCRARLTGGWRRCDDDGTVLDEGNFGVRLALAGADEMSGRLQLPILSAKQMKAGPSKRIGGGEALTVKGGGAGGKDWATLFQQIGALIQGIGCIIILIPLVIVCVVVLWAVAC